MKGKNLRPNNGSSSVITSLCSFVLPHYLFLRMTCNEVFIAVVDYSTPIILNWPKVQCSFNSIMDGRSAGELLVVCSHSIEGSCNT
jgi:hypothetical protein